MTLGPHSSGDFGSWISSGLARTSWGHPVLLTQNSELAESESSVSCRLLAGLSLKAGPEKLVSVLPTEVGSGLARGFLPLCSLLIFGRQQLALLEAAVSLLKQSWD